ncbi:MAG: hypothetical protein E4G98_02035 [Promethearchaeota archaeon]|nr:MAG: hypothetical protein E4G98_02035 [Candidatus Lokiarchaeota archaeon]
MLPKNHNVPQIVEILLLNHRIAKIREPHDNSIHYLTQAKKIAEEANNPLGLGLVAEELAIHAYDHGEYELAFQHFSTTEINFLHAKNFRKIAETKYNLACIAAQLHIPENVISNLKGAINLNPKFRTLAIQDSDFQGLKNNSLFQEALGE